MFFFFKQKTAYEMRISDWSSDVCSSDLEDLYSLFRQHPAVSTDSRNIQPDSLFFALKGPHFNGNAYASQALEAGASFAIVDEAEYAVHDQIGRASCRERGCQYV